MRAIRGMAKISSRFCTRARTIRPMAAFLHSATQSRQLYGLVAGPLLRGKKKGKKGQGAPAQESSGSDGDGVALVDEKDLAKKLDSAKRSFETGLSKIRAGGADPAILDDVEVEAYGEMQPITSLGQVQEKGANALIVSVFDPSQGEAVASAIQDAGLGLNPSFDGQVVRVPVPKPTKESKQEGIKTAGKLAEAAKVRVRKTRQNALDRIKKAQKASELTEDDARRQSKVVEEAVEKANQAIAAALTEKKKVLEA